MNIVGSSITMQASHSKVSTKTVDESFKFWVGNQRPNFEGNGGRLATNQNGFNQQGDVVQVSDEAKKLMAENQGQPIETDSTKGIRIELSEEDKRLIQLLESFLKRVTGKEVKLNVLRDINVGQENSQGINFKEPRLVARPAGWGLEYEYHAVEYEAEQMSYTASGVIKGNDGREINFSIEMNMSREYYARQDFVLRAGDAKKVDPLVINFDGNVPQLTDLKFKFDLNADGTEDQISFLKPGSGFLALDKNQDGVINDGQELFGPTSGDGFEELAAYDEDGNGWIDDKDSVYQRLSVWTKDNTGKDHLIALSEAGVGAVYLGNIDTPFEIKGANNQLNGVVQKTGVYVTNNDTVGTVQQVDLTI